MAHIALATVSKQWPSTGSPSDVAVAITANAETNQVITETSDDKFVIAWAQDTTGQTDLYAQKFSYAAGVAAWESATQITNTGSISETPAAILSNNNGGAYIIWNYLVSGSHCDIEVEQLDSNGAEVSGFPVNVTTDSVSSSICETFMQALPDGSGGLYIAWGLGGGSIDTAATTDLYITRIDNTGGVEATWNTGGAGTFKPVAFPKTGGGTSSDNSAQIVADGSNNVVAIYESTTGAYYFATTKFSSAGAIAAAPWSTPLEVDANSNGSLGRHLVADGSGGVIISYQTGANGVWGTIEAQRINAAGSLQWGTGLSVNGADIDTAYNSPRIAADGSGGAIVVWQVTSDMYASHVTSAGALDSSGSWSASPIALSDITDSNADSFSTSDLNNVLPDGNAGAYILFKSFETAESDNLDHLQHIDSTGDLELGADGLVVSSAKTPTSGIMTSDSSSGIAIAYQVAEADANVYTQYFSSDPCSSIGSSNLCGSQTISSSTLTFQDIPDTFNFGTIVAGSAQDLYNNTTPPDASKPGANDLLQIYDDRNSGGFTVTVDPDGTFTDGTNTIPLTNLYIVTSLDEADAGNISGITYGSGFTGNQTVSAPLYVDTDTANMEDTATYTTDFSAAPIVIMNGTIGSAFGRVGTMALFTSFHLHNDAVQQAGSYALTLTYTLSDSTT